MFLSFAHRPKFALTRKVVSSVMAFAFLTNLATPAGAQLASLLPTPGSAVTISPVFMPPLLKGVLVHPENPFLFDFVVSPGQDKVSGQALKDESQKLVKFFLTAMTIPDKEAWVNLSPYEKDRIIPPALGETQMGQVMLEQDYALKQMSSAMTDPRTELGAKFWQTVRQNAQAKLGTTDVPMSTFNKVWIVPGKAEVAQEGGQAYVTESSLKVMMEEDYEALQKTVGNKEQAAEATQTNKLTSEVFRTMILPKLEENVNTSKEFSGVRQIYEAAILAVWYKEALKESLLGKIYADKSKVKGIESLDKDYKQGVYARYLEAFKQGAYNFIKEEADASGEVIPRRYFSGGAQVVPEKAQLSLAGNINDVAGSAIKDAVVVSAAVVETPEEGKAVAASGVREEDKQAIDALAALIQKPGKNDAELVVDFLSPEYIDSFERVLELLEKDEYRDFRVNKFVSALVLYNVQGITSGRQDRDASENFHLVKKELLGNKDSLFFLRRAIELIQSQFNEIKSQGNGSDGQRTPASPLAEQFRKLSYELFGNLGRVDDKTIRDSDAIYLAQVLDRMLSPEFRALTLFALNRLGNDKKTSAKTKDDLLRLIPLIKELRNLGKNSDPQKSAGRFNKVEEIIMGNWEIISALADAQWLNQPLNIWAAAQAVEIELLALKTTAYNLGEAIKARDSEVSLPVGQIHPRVAGAFAMLLSQRILSDVLFLGMDEAIISRSEDIRGLLSDVEVLTDVQNVLTERERDRIRNQAVVLFDQNLRVIGRALDVYVAGVQKEGFLDRLSDVSGAATVAAGGVKVTPEQIVTIRASISALVDKLTFLTPYDRRKALYETDRSITVESQNGSQKWVMARVYSNLRYWALANVRMAFDGKPRDVLSAIKQYEGLPSDQRRAYIDAALVVYRQFERSSDIFHAQSNVETVLSNLKFLSEEEKKEWYDKINQNIEKPGALTTEDQSLVNQQLLNLARNNLKRAQDALDEARRSPGDYLDGDRTERIRGFELDVADARTLESAADREVSRDERLKSIVEAFSGAVQNITTHDQGEFLKLIQDGYVYPGTELAGAIISSDGDVINYSQVQLGKVTDIMKDSGGRIIGVKVSGEVGMLKISEISLVRVAASAVVGVEKTLADMKAKGLSYAQMVAEILGRVDLYRRMLYNRAISLLEQDPVTKIAPAQNYQQAYQMASADIPEVAGFLFFADNVKKLKDSGKSDKEAITVALKRVQARETAIVSFENYLSDPKLGLSEQQQEKIMRVIKAGVENGKSAQEIVQELKISLAAISRELSGAVASAPTEEEIIEQAERNLFTKLGFSKDETPSREELIERYRNIAAGIYQTPARNVNAQVKLDMKLFVQTNTSDDDIYEILVGREVDELVQTPQMQGIINEVAVELMIQPFDAWLEEHASNKSLDLGKIEKDPNEVAKYRLRWARIQDDKAAENLQSVQRNFPSGSAEVNAAQFVKDQTQRELLDTRAVFAKRIGSNDKFYTYVDKEPIQLRDEFESLKKRFIEAQGTVFMRGNAEAVRLEIENAINEVEQLMQDQDIPSAQSDGYQEWVAQVSDKIASLEAMLNQQDGDYAVFNGESQERGEQKSASSQVGGINFDPTLMNLQVKRDKNGVPLPLPQQDLQNINIEGLYPVIINIAPATMANFPLLSKAGEKNEKVPSAKDDLSPVDRQKLVGRAG